MSTLQFISGVCSGAHLHGCLSSEKSLRAGHAHAHIALLHCSAVGGLVRRIEQISLASGSSFKQSWSAWTVQTASLCGLAYCAGREKSPAWFKKATYLVYDNLGTVVQVANLVSAVALLYLGAHAQGIGLLVAIGTSLLLSQKNIFPETWKLPQKWKPRIENALAMVGLVYSLVYGGPLDKIIIAITLLPAVLSLLPKRFQPTLSPKPIQGQTLEEAHTKRGSSETRFDGLTEMLSCSLPKIRRDYEVEKSHIRELVLPPRKPEIDLKCLKHLMDKIDWEANSAVVSASVNGDEHYRQHSDGGGSPKKYIQDGVDIFLNRLTNKEILAGEPVSYEDLLAYTEWFAENLPNLDSMAQVDILVKIGILGRYCGPKLFYFLQNAYQESATGQSFDIRKAVLTLTHDRRNRVMSVLIAKLKEDIAEQKGLWRTILRRGSYALSIGDLHYFNHFVHNLFPLLSATCLSAQNDKEAHNPFTKLIFKAPIYSEVKDKAWAEYSSVFLMAEHLTTHGRRLRLPSQMLTDWLLPIKEKLDCDVLDLIESETELNDKGSYDSFLTHKGALLLLLDCGIIKKKSDKE
jgi:hypothetical protein